MANGLSLLLLLMIVSVTSWLCWLSIGDVLASVFVAGTCTLAIVPSMLRGARPQPRRRSL